ncbi:MAG: helix-turn-helix domain-containing protein [Propionibacteriaceae bacterium]|jgi:excisionase family DNA binding protein|nr:helix-turn-helix domain-containing protein [Propionibacteriaceae bacterium]
MRSTPTPVVVSPNWFTLKDAARHTGTSTDTLRRRINDGQLPAYYVGKSRMVRVKRDDVDALMRPVVTVGRAR